MMYFGRHVKCNFVREEILDEEKGPLREREIKINQNFTNLVLANILFIMFLRFFSFLFHLLCAFFSLNGEKQQRDNFFFFKDLFHEPEDIFSSSRSRTYRLFLPVNQIFTFTAMDNVKATARSSDFCLFAKSPTCVNSCKQNTPHRYLQLCIKYADDNYDAIP